MSVLIKKKTLIRLKGNKEKARRIRRILWRALVRGEVLPFTVDAYAGEIWIKFEGKEDEGKVRKLISEADTIAFTRKQAVPQVRPRFRRKRREDRKPQEAGNNQRGHRQVILAFVLN